MWSSALHSLKRRGPFVGFRPTLAPLLAVAFLASTLAAAAPAAAATTIHVGSITVQLWGSPKPGDGEFTVVIQDEYDQPVANADVTAYIYVQNSSRSTSGYTDSTGSVTLATGGSLKGSSFTITIHSVTDSGGYVYDSSANVVTTQVVRL